MGILFMIVVVSLAILAVVEKPKETVENSRKYRTYNSIEKIVGNYGTTAAKENVFQRVNCEMEIDGEYKLKMTDEAFGFKRVEILKKRNNEWMIVETQIDDRSDFGNTTMELSGEWADLVYEKLESCYQKITDEQKTLETV